MSHESETPNGNGGLDFEAGLLQPLRRFDATLQDWCSREQASAGARTKAAIADRLALDAGEQKLQECLKTSYPDHSLDGNSSLQDLASIARGQRTELHQILELVRSHLSHFEGTEGLSEQLPAAGGAARKMTSADVVGLLAEQLDIASRNLVKARAAAEAQSSWKKKEEKEEKEEETVREGRRRDDDDSNHKDRRARSGDDDDRGGRGRRAAAEKDRGSSRDRRGDGGRDRGGARGGGRGDRCSRSRSRRGGGEARRQDRDGGRGGRQRDNSRGRQPSRGRGDRDNGRDERRRDSSRRDGRGDGGRDARRRESNGARDRDRDDK